MVTSAPRERDVGELERDVPAADEDQA